MSNPNFKLGAIVVTGANGQVGKQLLRALQGNCQKIIALVRNPVNLPADLIISDWLNSSSAREAISQADGIVHLAGSLNPRHGDYLKANLQTTKTLISALNPKQTKIIYLSYVGATKLSSNVYLSTKAEAEELLQATGCAVTILRCTHIIGSPQFPGITAEKLLSHQGKAVTVLGLGKQKVNPIYLEDVIKIIIRALTNNYDGIFEVGGLDIWTMDQLVRLINQNSTIKINHIPPLIAKLLPIVVKDLPLPLIEVMMADSISNNQHFEQTFSMPLTPLQGVWQKY